MSNTCFLWDPIEDNIVRELDYAADAIAEYTTEPVVFGNVVSQTRGDLKSHFHFDGLGSTLAVTSNNQQATDFRAYSAFGEPAESIGSTTFPFQYIGQKGYYRESVSGECLVSRRVYESASARWNSADPIGIQLQHSVYDYARNIPTRFFDASGLFIFFSGCSSSTTAPPKQPAGPPALPKRCIVGRFAAGQTIRV